MAKPGRHAPAFILLMLAQGPKHGLGILNAMNDLVKGNRLDTAVIYRVLKQLEASGDIQSEWADSVAGPKKKVYHITDTGMQSLVGHRKEIEQTIKRLNMFIDYFDALS